MKIFISKYLPSNGFSKWWLIHIDLIDTFSSQLWDYVIIVARTKMLSIFYLYGNIESRRILIIIFTYFKVSVRIEENSFSFLELFVYLCKYNIPLHIMITCPKCLLVNTWLSLWGLGDYLWAFLVQFVSLYSESIIIFIQQQLEMICCIAYSQDSGNSWTMKECHISKKCLISIHRCELWEGTNQQWNTLRDISDSTCFKMSSFWPFLQKSLGISKNVRLSIIWHM